MARNSTGVYSRVTPPGAGGYVTGTDILPAEVNSEIVDLGNEISNSIDKSGRTTITANIPMNSKKFTGLAAGTVSGDSLEFSQLLPAATQAETNAFITDLKTVTPLKLGPVLNRFPVISATVAANALTLGMSAQYTEFRNASLTSGTVSVINIPAVELIVPSGATLGTANNVASYLLLILINNAGTAELAVTNLAGLLSLDESNLISTTAIDTASDSANVVYSTTARTNVPYRVVGLVSSTQVTAGAWASAPTLIQGVHGQAWGALQSIGYGQSWQNLGASRSLGTDFVNTTGRPIKVSVLLTSTVQANAVITITQNGSAIAIDGSGGAATVGLHISEIVPPGATYNVTASGGVGTLSTWRELR